MLNEVNLYNIIQAIIPLGLAFGSILLIIGGGRAALRFIILILVFALILPILWNAAPIWVTFIILLFITLALLRALVGVILGHRVSERIIASLATDLIRFLWKALILPLRIVQKIIANIKISS